MNKRTTMSKNQREISNRRHVCFASVDLHFSS